MNRTLKKKVRPDTKIKSYKATAALVLLYGSKTWTMTTKIKNKLQSGGEMTFLRGVKGYTRAGRIRNQDVCDELDTYNVSEKILVHRQKRKEHPGRMNNERLPKLAWKYKAVGKKKIGRQGKGG